MVGEGQLFIGFFDLFFGSCFCYTKGGVVILCQDIGSLWIVRELGVWSGIFLRYLLGCLLRYLPCYFPRYDSFTYPIKLVSHGAVSIHPTQGGEEITGFDNQAIGGFFLSDVFGIC